MRVRGAREGAKVHLDAGEGATLVTLLSDLLLALEPEALAAHDPVRRRLFPDGLRDDPEAAQSFRDMTESSLRSERVSRARQCLEEVRAVGDRPADVVLDEESGDRWLRVLTDLRLAVGTRLGVTDDTDFEDAYAGGAPDPQTAAKSVYLWLTAVQDALVRALS